jgi:hypothetical protein
MGSNVAMRNVLDCYGDRKGTRVKIAVMTCFCVQFRIFAGGAKQSKIC